MNTKNDLAYRCVSYPNFEPDHTWLRKILLFVDEVHRIVPVDLERTDSDNLKRLMEHCEGAVQNCDPQPYIEIDPDQAEIFGRALEQPKFIKVAQAKNIKMWVSPVGSIEVENWEFLHVGKIGHEVRAQLERKNMLRKSPVGDDHWPMVPRNVGGLILGMIASQVAEKTGVDAITDQPLAFVLNSMNQCSNASSLVEGILASTLIEVHVPKDIALIPVKQYAELRKQHSAARVEFAEMVRTIKDSQRLSTRMSPDEFRKRLDGIVLHVDSEIDKFRRSKQASKVKKWIPMILSSLFPAAISSYWSEIPAIVAGGISFGCSVIGNALEKPSETRFPKVLQTFCAANDRAAQAALKHMLPKR